MINIILCFSLPSDFFDKPSNQHSTSLVDHTSDDNDDSDDDDQQQTAASSDKQLKTSSSGLPSGKCCVLMLTPNC